MNVIETNIQDVLLLEPRCFRDERGFFLVTYQTAFFKEQLGLDLTFVQDNHSRSVRHVLRGLHYQTQHPQGKLVRVVNGAVYDVAVDIRADSPTFGQWFGVELTAENQRMLWVPPGLAHGFLVLSDVADFLYKVTDIYAPQYERTLAWDDPTVGISWPTTAPPLLSPKDAQGLSLAEIQQN